MLSSAYCSPYSPSDSEPDNSFQAISATDTVLKMLMFIGAVGATAANTAFALSSSMAAFCICWAVNALSLAMGWSPGCSILFRWIPKKRWGLFMGFLMPLLSWEV